MFSVEDVKDEKKSKKHKRKKLNLINRLRHINNGQCIPIIIGAILIILLIIYYFYKSNYENFNYLKIDKDKYLVYTIYTKSNDMGSITNVPYININSSKIDKINKEIIKTSEDFLNIKGNTILYEYSVSGNTLSLVLKMVNNNTLYTSEIKFKSYNINLKTLKLIDNNNLLKLYNVSNDKVSNIIDNKDEVKKGFIPKEECDYNCYLEWRDIKNMTDNISYFIRDGKLYVFKEFIPYSVYGEEEYFTDDSFKIYIAG